jgi:hypothetical protein
VYGELGAAEMAHPRRAGDAPRIEDFLLGRSGRLCYGFTIMSSSSADLSTSGAVRLVTRGSAFETWAGPAGGGVRYDWTRKGIIRLIILGHGHAGYVAPSVKLFDTVLGFTGRIGVMFDCWDMTGYDSEFRVQTSAWGSKHQSVLEESFMVTRSKLVAMGISVANLAVGGKIKCFSKRVDFDVEAKNNGFLLNPPMPGR